MTQQPISSERASAQCCEIRFLFSTYFNQYKRSFVSEILRLARESH